MSQPFVDALANERAHVFNSRADFSQNSFNLLESNAKVCARPNPLAFEPLPAGSSLTVVAMASRQLAAYYEDEG